MGRHTFRFFVEALGAAGAQLQLGAPDVSHLRVLRAGPGTEVEVVDSAGVLWAAAVLDQRSVRLREQIAVGEAPPAIVLYAGVLSGQAWDALVDGAVQSGVTRIVPMARNPREGVRLEQRSARSARIAAAAARQSKRLVVPEVVDAVPLAGMVDVAPGVILVPGAGDALVDVPLPVSGGEFSVLVGGSEGLDSTLVADLQARGWRSASLGGTVLRSELAAAVAVAIVAQRLRPGR